MNARALLVATTYLLLCSQAWGEDAAVPIAQPSPSQASPPQPVPTQIPTQNAGEPQTPQTQPTATPVPPAAASGTELPPAPTTTPVPAAAESATQLPEIVIIQPKASASTEPPVDKRKVKPASDVTAKSSPPAKTQTVPKSVPKAQSAPAQVVAQSPPPETLVPPAGTSVVIGQDFAPVTTATSAEINASPGATVTDTLQKQPGVAGSTFAPGANRPILRGLDDNRVRVQENGIGTGDVSDLSEDHAIPIDPCSADKVEVVHGPAVLRYTNKAVGGVVAAENERVPTFMPANGASGEVRGGASSADKGRDGCFKATAGAQGFVIHADGFARHSDDYDTPHGRQANSAVDSNGYSIGGSYVWDDGFAGMAYTRFDSLYGIPGIESAAALGRIDMGQDKLTGKAEWRIRDFGIEAIRTWFGYSDYAHNELDFDAAVGADVIGSRFTNKEFEARGEIELARIATAAGALNGTAGIQASSRDLEGLSFGGDNLLEPNRTQKVAGFLFEQLQVAKPLRLLGSVRIERDEITGSTFADVTSPALPLFARDKTFDPISGGLGLLYDLPLGVVARASALYVERAPEAQELFSKGAHDATGTFEIGNPEIKEEKARTIELGLKRAVGGIRFDTTAYYTQFDGFIFRQVTGETCDVTIASCSPSGPGGGLKQIIFGQRDATFYGAELAGEYDVTPIWNGVWGLSSQYDFVHAQFSNGEFVPRIPPHRLGGGLYYRDRNWRASVGVLHAFAQNEISLEATRTDGYSLVNLEVSYTQKLTTANAWGPEFTIGMRGDNLLNDDVRNSASFKKDEVLAPGASVRVFGSIKLN